MIRKILLACCSLSFVLAMTAAQDRPLKPPTTSLGVVRPALAATIPATQHGNTLSWTQSSDATSTSTSNVYDVLGGCPTSLVLVTSQFTLLAANVAPSGPFVDTAVTANKTKSYVVTNVIGGVETGVSNCVSATTPNFPPQGLQVVAQ